ncbi:hypothetical protein P153DRAFT_388061 [Dothidotthia symphoricarpi CBS 119687]|uniref:IBR domain-containing protein n=1 Tax=Dothidotthia symphoricarpi CBS 119687 TaxID=1392245 RepID=A0A6A6A7F3_9PLEO|nr:uncharacterized protein P153DRAFT_388061 [Dothidotthia symphoricarpi CBS 119687]KAF2126737.1 hypothetical protein P153DRAFT_388061 [Dothidotthia symphoricarpi CBS 119687]
MCEQYDERKKNKIDRQQEEEASKMLVADTSTHCPGPECEYKTTKNGGCGHITCSGCNFEFCYTYSASY